MGKVLEIGAGVNRQHSIQEVAGAGVVEVTAAQGVHVHLAGLGSGPLVPNGGLGGEAGMTRFTGLGGGTRVIGGHAAKDAGDDLGVGKIIIGRLCRQRTGGHTQQAYKSKRQDYRAVQDQETQSQTSHKNLATFCTPVKMTGTQTARRGHAHCKTT
ncbi:hypothetical protein SBV1_2010003 [Verrucomicrobia bacterium]|nr:hypothetical protein SBV1_2010003 [Verrucomicrobiota bacterium]